MMKKIIYTFLICFYASASWAENNESKIVIDSLLGLNGKYSLEVYKKWGEIYLKYSRLVTKEIVSKEDLSYYLFLVFVADVKSKTSTGEDISQSYYLNYIKHEKAITQILLENPFLKPSSCSALEGYVDFYGKDANKKHVDDILKFQNKLGCK